MYGLPIIGISLNWNNNKTIVMNTLDVSGVMKTLGATRLCHGRAFFVGFAILKKVQERVSAPFRGTDYPEMGFTQIIQSTTTHSCRSARPTLRLS